MVFFSRIARIWVCGFVIFKAMFGYQACFAQSSRPDCCLMIHFFIIVLKRICPNSQSIANSSKIYNQPYLKFYCRFGQI